MSDEKVKQVIAQCKVVMHLAQVMVDIHRDYIKMFEAGSGAAHDLVDSIGERTAGTMEDLGDRLNGIDAVSEDDEWTEPIFHEAQRLWPHKDH